MKNTLSGIPLVASAAILTDPKAKTGRGAREVLTRSRDVLCTDTTPTPPRPAPVRLALRLQKMPFVKLQSNLRRFARRASTAKYLAAKLSEDSPYRAAVERSQTQQLNALRQAQAEIQSRTH